MIHLLIVITGILLLAYAVLIFYYHRIWDQIPIQSDPVNLAIPRRLMVSVIIPARNEFSLIGHCLDSIFNQSYPKDYIEVIVVNDYSTDGTETLVLKHKLKCKLLNLSDYVTENLNSYKKKAIETAINFSSVN